MKKTINSILHFFNPIRCLDITEWDGDTLICKKCGTQIAFKYKALDDDIKIYIFRNYRRFKYKIERI